MAYTPLSTDFKDQILSDVNTQRKYKQTVNEDGTVSLLDMTAYDQQGSSYSAKDINEERKAINNIYANKLVTLDEIDLVTEPGFFVDAQVVKELNSKMICGLSSESVLIDSNSRGELDVKFKTPFLSVPTYVVATPYVSMDNVGADITVSKITALGFHVSIRNQSATGAYFKVSYIAGSK